MQIGVLVVPDSYYVLEAKRAGLLTEDPFIINHDGGTERHTASNISQLARDT